MSLFKKMVLALPPEFFEGLQWQNGDKFLHKELGSEFWNEKAIGDYKLYDNVIMYLVLDYFDTLDGEIRHLPNQKQLQSMLNLSPIEYIEDFYEYAQEPLLSGMDNEQFKTDMECFTLAYVMDRKFKMYWDGKKWLRNDIK